jgi:ribosomal protein S18 acetylase RimI-like enzyme
LKITTASLSDVDETVSCLATAFAQDPITGYLLQTGAGYHERVSQFFSMLMRARIALGMPVFLARGDDGICGASMGYSTVRSDWPGDITAEWARFEEAIPGAAERMATYDEVAAKFKPAEPHYYLGVIGTHPKMHGRGIGTQLITSFCQASANDRLSAGVYLETAQEANLGFYERAGFVETGRGKLGQATLWCMYLPHERR